MLISLISSPELFESNLGIDKSGCPRTPSATTPPVLLRSSCRIYVNQKLVRQMGTPDTKPVSRHIQNTLVSLPSGSVELVIQTANDTHYYSGLTYPLILGTNGMVTNALAQKLIFYALLCFFPLGAAVIWVSESEKGRTQSLWHTAWSACFFLFTSATHSSTGPDGIWAASPISLKMCHILQCCLVWFC